MLDQDTALALLTIADEAQARLVLVGDRHQLPAVGRGGVLDLATDIAPPSARFTLDVIHRFEDPEYAELSLLMRRGERPGEVFDRLHARGEIRIHATDVERLHALAQRTRARSSPTPETRSPHSTPRSAPAASPTATQPRDGPTTTTWPASHRRRRPDRHAPQRPGPRGRQPRHLDRHPRTRRRRPRREGRLPHAPPAAPLRRVLRRAGLRHTAYGAQGQTTDRAHVADQRPLGAAATYVGMSRGRQHNVAHLVADSTTDARAQWISAFSRDRADLGPPTPDAEPSTTSSATDCHARPARLVAVRGCPPMPPAHRRASQLDGPPPKISQESPAEPGQTAARCCFSSRGSRVEEQPHPRVERNGS